jgi:hydrogenase large subunit
MHMASINAAGKITAYQCIVPTTWNASPKDQGGVRGPMEEAMIGVPYDPRPTTATGGAGASITAGGGVEALRVAQSFDPCIACAVH